MEIKKDIINKLFGDKRVALIRSRCNGKRREFFEWESMMTHPKAWFDYVNKKSLIEGVLYPYMQYAHTLRAKKWKFLTQIELVML